MERRAHTTGAVCVAEVGRSYGPPVSCMYRRYPKRGIIVVVRHSKSREETTLLDVLIDGFEKNEVLDGHHFRNLPMPDEPAARAKFESLVEEARRWKGEPARCSAPDDRRRLAAWQDLEIRQAGLGIMVRVRAPWFDWWHAAETWRDDPMGEIFDWLREER